MEYAYPIEIIDEYVKKGYWNSVITADLCDENALKYPDDEALVDSRKRLTWRQVKEKTDTLALSLLDIGFQPGDVLLAQLYNCVDFFLLRVASEKAGIMLLSAAATYSHLELRSIIMDAGVKGAVLPKEFRGFDYYSMAKNIQSGYPGLKHIIVVGEDVPNHAIPFDSLLERKERAIKYDLRKTRISAFGCCAIVPSAGSTGRSKLGIWPCCARLFSAKQYVKKLGLTHNDISIALGPFHSGASDHVCYFAALLAGLKVVFLERFTAEAACALIEKEKVTIAGTVPTLLIRLLGYADLDKHDLSSLRIVFSSTAALSSQTAMEIQQRLECRIADGYGSLESGSVALTFLDEAFTGSKQAFHKIIPGVEVSIADEKGNEVAGGEIGEVRVCGPGCPPGYYNNPEETAKVHKKGWVYMSEDGKIDEEGNLMLAGRKRDIIMRGGQNIYPREIDELLLQHPNVREVAVVSMPDPEMGEKACAYVVTKAGRKLSFDEMISFLRGMGVANFKLPERLEIIAEMPLVAGQHKIEKKALEKDIAEKLRIIEIKR